MNRKEAKQSVAITLAFVPYGTYCSNMIFPTQDEVAEYLDAARQRKGLTVSQLADLSGLSPRRLKAKLTATRPMTTGDLYAIATALDTTPGEVYTDLA